MSPAPEQRRLLAIMVADIAGYSRMMARDENGTYAQLRELQGGVILPGVTRNNGEVVKWTGDGFMATFASAVDAVRAAVEIQSGVKTANSGLPKDRQQWLRIGINVGDVIVVPGDIYGDAVNIAARLQALAPEGGIAASQMVRDTVRGKFSVEFTDQGDVAVKNIPDPVRIFSIGFEPVAWTMERAVPARATLQPAPAKARSVLRFAWIPLVVLAGVATVRFLRPEPPPSQTVVTPQPGPAPSLSNRPVASNPVPAPSLRIDNPPPSPAFRTAFGERLAVLLPALPADAREKLINDYSASPANKALAVAPPAGRVWRVANRPAAAIAVTEALEGCEIAAGMPCGVVVQNDKVEPTSATGPIAIRPMPRVAYSGPYDPAMVPTGDFNATDLAKVYRAPQRYKALALHPTGWLFGSSGAATQQETERAALASCAADRKAKGVEGPCYLYAAGDYTVLPQRITTADDPQGAEADLFEGVWRGKMDNGQAAMIVVLGGRAVQFLLDDAVQPITKSTIDGKTISFGDRRYAASLTLDGASEISVEFTGPGANASGTLRKQ